MLSSEQSIKYVFNNKSINFNFNKDDIVQEIVVNILTNGEDNSITKAGINEKDDSLENILFNQDNVTVNNDGIIYTNKKAGFLVTLPKS